MGLLHYLAAAAAVGVLGIGMLAFAPKNGDRHRNVPDLPEDVAECRARPMPGRRFAYERDGMVAQCLAERRRLRGGM